MKKRITPADSILLRCTVKEKISGHNDALGKFILKNLVTSAARGVKTSEYHRVCIRGAQQRPAA
jgi:hypothetical protein